MRSFGVLMLISGLAAADPAPAAKLPSKVVEVEAWTPPPRAAQNYPGVTGKSAAGLVIDPGHAGDGQRWPHGIWIRPPATRDDNVMRSGTMTLPDPASFSVRLARRFDDTIGTMLELLMTPRFVHQM